MKMIHIEPLKIRDNSSIVDVVVLIRCHMPFLWLWWYLCHKLRNKLNNEGSYQIQSPVINPMWL